MKLSKDHIGGTLLLVFFLCYGWLSLDISLLPAHKDLAFTARTLPYSLAALGIVLAATLIAWSPAAIPTERQPLHWGRFLCFLVLMSIYGFTLRQLGFIPATIIFLSCGFMLLGERRVLWLVGLSSLVACGFWALMNFGLGVFIAPWPTMLAANT